MDKQTVVSIHTMECYSVLPKKKYLWKDIKEPKCILLGERSQLKGYTQHSNYMIVWKGKTMETTRSQKAKSWVKRDE